ncbi:hypothetical protein [Pseudactinotalea sp.]|uniref:hypothetical protein n=1 Tax=Pseudactinotalea sp. TaxID=1926260 RepID=UPI003B3B7C78
MTSATLAHELDEDHLDLSPEVMCSLMRRRARNAAMSAAGSTSGEAGSGARR